MMFGGSPKCPVCSKAVYFNERVHAIGEEFHKECFKCSNCNKRLEQGKQHDNEGKLFCAPCHSKLFGPKGYGFGGGAGVLSDTGLDKEGKPVDYRANQGGGGNTTSSPSTVSGATPSGSSGASPISNVRASVRSFLKGSSASPTSSTGGCPKCGKSVGFAEKLIAMGGTWHKECFTCAGCSKTLRGGEYTNHADEPYCKPCHSKKFGPKGFGYGGAVLAENHN